MTYPGPLTFPGPYTFPGYSTDPDPLGNVRVEVAFATGLDDPAPAYVDVGEWVIRAAGIQIVRGRLDEYATVSPGTCNLTFDNTTGWFTAGYAGSPWFPNVKIRKKLRVTVRDVTVAGNMLTVEDATFEAGTVGSWIPGGTAPPTLTSSVTHPHSGAKGLLVTWGTAGTGPAAGPAALTGLVTGRAYTASCQVWVPAGSPNVQLAAAGTVGAASAVTDGFALITVTFTATGPSHTLTVQPSTAPTAGQQCWLDDAQVDEAAALAGFTTAAPPIGYRFTGYVEEWPTVWPGGGDYSEAQVTAVDRFKRLGIRAAFKSVIEQEYLSDNPYAYYTLGEPAASTQAGDTSKNGRNPLTIAQLGAGGSLTFGSGVGPPTDSLTAAVLAPVNTTNGKYLTVTLPVSSSTSTGQGLDVFFLTSVAALQTIATLAGNASGAALLLQVDATGKLTASSPLNPLLAAVTSAGAVADGATHHAAATLTYAGPNVTLTLILDGTTVGTSTVAATVSQFSVLTVGGGSGTVFAGTISHAACYDTAPAVARFTDHRTAGVTGFAGERSDQRIARYARWAGVPAAEQSLEVGLSTSIPAVDTTGQAPLQAMQDIADTESGILAINGAGLLTFQSRGHRYNTSSVLSLAGEDIDPSTQFVSNDAYLINDVTASRDGGITFRAVNAQSVTDYDTATPTTNPRTLLTTSDNEVIDAANWKSNQTAVPAPRIPALTLDTLTNPAIAGQVLALDLSSRITASALPQYAPTATPDLFIEGWTENISDAGWTVAFNTSPAPTSGVWQLGSALYSQLGVSTRLAY